MKDWKPGDVAMVTWDNATESERARGVRRMKTARGIFADDCWIFGRISRLPVDSDVIHDVRPLVVLYLDDMPLPHMAPTWLRAQAEEIDLRSAGTSGSSVSRQMRWLAGQIEAQIQPPPLAEPTDPAVRVFASETTWAKVGPWWVSPSLAEVPREWDWLVERDDFRVDSDGVQP